MDLQSLKPQGYINGNWCGADIRLLEQKTESLPEDMLTGGH